VSALAPISENQYSLYGNIIARPDNKLEWRCQHGLLCQMWMQQIEEDPGLMLMTPAESYMTKSLGRHYDPQPSSSPVSE